ncbi:hypothetical protein D031_4717B, partial [Vibrio parahaemolyticus VP-48]
SAHS